MLYTRLQITGEYFFEDDYLLWVVYETFKILATGYFLYFNDFWLLIAHDA